MSHMLSVLKINLRTVKNDVQMENGRRVFCKVLRLYYHILPRQTSSWTNENLRIFEGPVGLQKKQSSCQIRILKLRDITYIGLDFAGDPLNPTKFTRSRSSFPEALASQSSTLSQDYQLPISSSVTQTIPQSKPILSHIHNHQLILPPAPHKMADTPPTTAATPPAARSTKPVSEALLNDKARHFPFPNSQTPCNSSINTPNP